MRKKPFIGILLDSMEEVRQVFQPGMQVPEHYDYMVGVHAVVRGDAFPRVAAHRAVYMGDPSDIGSKEMTGNLKALPTCNTLFFDGWPHIGRLDAMKNQKMSLAKDVGVIVNLPDSEIEWAEWSPEPAARTLAQCRDTIDYLCFNGGGRPDADYNPEFTRTWVSHLQKNGSCGICVAGKFCEASVERLRPLLRQYPETSVIAGRRLRDADGTLNVDRARRYLAYAGELYDQYLAAA